MGHTLAEIAQQLIDSNKKVQLIYAFNGVGKTRLSREFKQFIAPKTETEEDESDSTEPWLAREKILYYSAFTEDLFYWDNDLELDSVPKLKIQPNSFTDWILIEQGQDQNIITNFQRFTNNKLTPKFNEEYTIHDKDNQPITVKAFSEVTFSIQRGDDEGSGNIKISKGEESNFVWSIFYTMLEQIIGVLKENEASGIESGDFTNLKYVFIDDPVSSLDENHLIELGVNVAELIKSSNQNLKFLITTHSPLFFNVLYSELSTKSSYMLEQLEDGNFSLVKKDGDSNKSFSYHLYLKKTLEEAINQRAIQKYHFMLLRNLYEKTAMFLGYPQWKDLLPNEKESYYNRIIHFNSHRKLSNEEVKEPTEPEKQMVVFLLKHLIENSRYWQEETQND
ncbi:anticodon nuclease [Leptospira kobayashii]|uniref:Anticodon nuclease n=1 Tax=Leptospira kobayashii TaxID=1917830 RepID=A0ABM7UQH1_9LEPT|nr:anticodon nuclease [Leptospira kobayashii]BDA77439.1 anticodon nuclease [Leptospira kobayashii]